MQKSWGPTGTYARASFGGVASVGVWQCHVSGAPAFLQSIRDERAHKTDYDCVRKKFCQSEAKKDLMTSDLSAV